MWLTHKIISHLIDRHVSTSHVSVYFGRVILNFFRKSKKYPRQPLFSAQIKICIRAWTLIELMVALPKLVLILNRAPQAMFQHGFSHILHTQQPAAQKAIESYSRGSCMVAGVL